MAAAAFLALVFVPSAYAMGSISISEGPQNVTILRGGTVELRCVFANIGRTQVMWFRSGGEMISNGNSILANARPGQGSYHLAGDRKRGEYFLVIPDVRVGDADEYSCAYTKENGDMDSRSGFLIVQAPPSSGYPMCSVEPVSPRVGDYVTFICISEGGVPNANLVWYRNNLAKTPVTLQMSRFKKVLKLDDMNAQFVCQADSPAEDSPRRCDVRPVQIAPSVVMNPSELHGVVGNDFFVSCIRVDKPSQTNFMWFYNGDAIDNLADSRRFQILGNGDTLKIVRIARRDKGATLKCQLQIYKGFMKHASSAISVEVSDLNDPVLSTTSTFSSGVVGKDDSVTSYISDNANVTYGLITLFQDSNKEGDAQRMNTTLTLILILVSICFVVILVLCLVFFKTVRNRKVTENDGNIQSGESQRSNGNFRHVYETSFPMNPAESEAMLAGTDSQFDRAMYQDIDRGMVDNQGVPHNGETSRHTEVMRYHSDPVVSPKIPKGKMVPSNHATDGVYEVPFTDERTSPSSPSPSSPCSDGYVDIKKEKEQYNKFNDKPHAPILYKGGFQIKPNKKPGARPVLRPVKSEASIFDSVKIEDTRPITKYTSASDVSGEDVVNPLQKIESPKNKRIKPNSPPPTQLVPRPNNFVLKQSPNSEYSHEIQREIPSSSDVLSKMSPKLGRPMVALKPGIKTPPRQSHLQKSPGTPRNNFNRSDGLTDKDGYEIPVDEKTRLAKKNQKGSNNSYEYEQIDHVMTSPRGDKCVGSNNKMPPNEYTLLDKRTVERSNYQDLTPPSECPSSSGNSTPSRKTSQHEYETPLFNEPKKQTLDRPEYLEILD